MKRISLMLLFVPLFCSFACQSLPKCIPGVSQSCACPDGDNGSQVCKDDGTFGVCVCKNNPAGNKEANDENSGDKPDDFSTDGGGKESIPETSNNDTNVPPGALIFMTKFAGLWRGTSENTPLSNIPNTIIDMRPVADNILYGRADLDAGNSLKFGFFLEKHQGKTEFIYINGGSFQSMNRESRTRLVSFDSNKQEWKFCSLTGGCDYINATFTFHSETSMTLQVYVRKQQHLTWKASRLEKRAVPQPFPKSKEALGDGSQKFPKMASFKGKVTLPANLQSEAAVWFILTSKKCGMSMSCYASRYIMAKVNKGDKTAEVLLPELHQGDYFLQIALDKNLNWRTTFFPDSGDMIGAADAQISVTEVKEYSHQASFFYTVP